MIDFLKFDENIPDEMLAAYIDGNATEEENSRVEIAISYDETLLEATELVNDFNSFVSNDDMLAMEDSLNADEISVEFFQDDIVVAVAASEPSEIDFDFPLSNAEVTNNDLPDMFNETVEDINDLDF